VSLPAGTTVLSVNVTLNNFSEGAPDDVDVLLVGPTGVNAILMSDVGDFTNPGGVTLTLSDAAGSGLPDNATLVSGTFQPTNIGGGDAFPGPAPAPAGTSNLSAFDGTNPNGTWSLYVVDDRASAGTGSFAGGWSLDLTVLIP
jgi:hypothetical protein